MSSSQINKNIIFSIYSKNKTVFTLTDIAMLTNESNFKSLNGKLNYYVSKGKLFRPRKGIYVKANYNPEELACVLYTPSYISLDYVLQKYGIIFQYDERMTAISYLSRSIEIEDRTYVYRKVKGEILVVTQGINRIENINMATPERAFLDTLYLNKDYYFDNLNPLNKELVYGLLPLYNSQALTIRVNKLLKNG
ncbi:hypothetical protein [uncultured Bacteroides sp.]|uniref:type IV toxin-antitoxin system AbiEi family antitoxin domain-containing protein n=1 Tax=uncultured Bacteroides sp. TaxID=162156 RepID=UPI002AA91840|nr:hypothetical protein [uncultured Bacteroides sp.]